MIPSVLGDVERSWSRSASHEAQPNHVRAIECPDKFQGMGLQTIESGDRDLYAVSK